MRRVVVTGLGMVSPLACGVEPTWQRLIAGESGARRIESFDVSDLAGQDRLPDPARRRHERHLQSRPVDGAEGAAQGRRLHRLSRCARPRRRSTDAGWKPKTYDEQCSTGVMIGSGIGGLEGIAETAIVLKERGPRRVSPFFIPGRLINLASGYVSIAHGLKGPNHAVVTACSTGAHAIGDAARLIALGDADVMVAGGAESPVSRIGIAGFAACRALSTGFNDTPEQGVAALRPRSRRLRDGRGRRRRGARGVRARQGARRADLRRTDRLRHVGRRLPHHRAGRGRRRRVPLHDGGDQARRHLAGGDRLHQRARHLDAARRRDRARRRAAAGRQCRRTHVACRRPSRRSAICSARPARSRRSSRSWRCATASRRRRSISTIRRSRRAIDLVPHQARKREIERGAVEFVRIWRHQCVAGLPPGRLERTQFRPATTPTFRHIIRL